MKKAKLHARETERLNALLELKLLDSTPEREFDDLTLIASQICKTPIALISLVDGSRQWFLSKVGLSAPETPRDFAFCAHTILQEDVFVVADSDKDERFADNPLVTGHPHVKFYAGAPILDPQTKLPIGTICVIDNKPRSLGQSERIALKALSNQINKLLELRIRIANLSSLNEKLVFQKTAIENMSEGVVLQDASGRIFDFNQAALEVLGLTADQLVGKTSMDPDWHATREDGSPFPGEEHPAMRTLATGKIQRNVVMGIETRDDHVRWIQINSAPIFLRDQKKPSHSVTTFADITKERNAQQALVQSAKLSSLGEMAGGIAHEINTPLAIILAASKQVEQLIKDEPLNRDRALYKMGKIESTAKRISQIVRGLKSFSRDAGGDPRQPSSMQQTVADAIALCGEKFKVSTVTLENRASGDALVNCVPTQISQVVLNLLSNAFDAAESQSEKWVRIDLEVIGDMVQIQVTDSGPGISKEIVSRIMQPFFTTKPVGKGTGLGLSISKGIVEAYGGRLFYEKRSNHTCFIVELPKMTNPDKPGAL